MLAAVIWALLLAGAGVLLVVSVLVTDDVVESFVESVDACPSVVDVVVAVSPAVASVALSGVELADVVADELVETRRDPASERCDVPALEAVDEVTERVLDAIDAVDEVLAVRLAAVDDEVTVPFVDFGPRAV
ncbi:hypothetical protein ORI20_01295 [Mycobacterium sp. CVI_P3]|nr:hypothetical protein [Mycobacterium pinniadriaticum]MCX2928890.1 hypothetical protein [Mycobacterium pinniadriaticum]